MPAREFPISTELRQVVDLFSRAGARPHPDTPKPYAGAVLLRDTPDGLEVFVTRTQTDPGIADPGRWSFPVAPTRAGDAVRAPLSAWNAADCARALRVDNQARALSYFTAAARVLLMRMGVLLAALPSGRLATAEDFPWLERGRTAVEDRRQKFIGLLRSQSMTLRLDMLHPWLRWVNTEWQLRRMDTVYFTLALPHGQRVRFRPVGDAWGGWLSPAEVLARADAAAQEAGAGPNEFISLPTRLICESLLDTRTVGSAMLRVRDLTPVRPGLVHRGSEWLITLDPPADPSDRGALRSFEPVDPTGTGAEEDDDAATLTGGDEFDEEEPFADDEAAELEAEADDADRANSQTSED
ncbi:hypothetical protein NQ038_00875 [Brevibacterium sp. 50QC2O2]|jgi:hypothetical protein|uniref:hypothetical protein n=1 Tax=Brevibacterium TaxID=1696 RepID=UPI00211B93BB|nr:MULTISPECIES: hypothetical protein [unclassified Brevibacterium]MCQ9368602.1 hypothetical protein [Brevibacterium sp. 91QC2O2]MCQ9385330.1 hypothetical protein [Brevibacterium sp. 68QC2CO]MCQ9387209.1 hypothetical protein [Brevibacterium sp. 50QC2O2]